jgi:hypothetical protein
MLGTAGGCTLVFRVVEAGAAALDEAKMERSNDGFADGCEEGLEEDGSDKRCGEAGEDFPKWGIVAGD